MKLNPLTPEEAAVIINKGTERSFTGKFTDHTENGIYVCRQCSRALYRSESKFKSSCGWPSFDEELPGAVKRLTDADGRRTEILCNYCDGHLGHVFEGENFTAKNTRHCVNSISMDFISGDKLERGIFASGCFWGTEYYLQKIDGVLRARSGYIGGVKDDPGYEAVCTGKSGHAEAVEVLFDTDKTNFTDVAKLYFETHDPTQLNRQGPDMGTQYRSEIFFFSDQQKKIAEDLIEQLKGKGFDVVTKLSPATNFWEAEDYHQNYYENKGQKPYCHIYQAKF